MDYLKKPPWKNFLFFIFLQSIHQVDMKNVFKWKKHFFGYFNALKTHGEFVCFSLVLRKQEETKTKYSAPGRAVNWACWLVSKILPSSGKITQALGGNPGPKNIHEISHFILPYVTKSKSGPLTMCFPIKLNITKKKEQMPPRRRSLITRGFESREQPIKIPV